MSLFRRYISGDRPLLVWGEDEEAADRTAAVHAAMLPPVPFSVFLDPSTLELRIDEDDGA